MSPSQQLTTDVEVAEEALPLSGPAAASPTAIGPYPPCGVPKPRSHPRIVSIARRTGFWHPIGSSRRQFEMHRREVLRRE